MMYYIMHLCAMQKNAKGAVSGDSHSKARFMTIAEKTGYKVSNKDHKSHDENRCRQRHVKVITIKRNSSFDCLKFAPHIIKRAA